MNNIDTKKTTFVGYTELGNMRGHSLKENLQKEAYPEERMIANYLRSASCAMVGPGYDRDIFTGKPIGCISIFTDGVYSWPGELAHYVETYHLRLPQDFEAHILKQQNMRTMQPK